MNRVRRVVIAVAVGAALSGIAQAAPQTQSQPPTAPPPATQPPAMPPPPQPAPPTTPPQKPDEPPNYEETVVVSGSKGGGRSSSTRAPTMSVITSQTIETAPVGKLCRAAADDPRRQHHAGLGSRHQRDQPRGDRHAGHRPAGAARRPQPLSGFLRLRDVGFPAGELQRGQAGRGDPRAGVGGLGRQRALRRRQRHHQVAARDAGHQRDVRLRWLRSARARTRARSGTQRHARGSAERSLGVQAVGRRLLAGCAGAADRADSLRHSVGLHGARPRSIRRLPTRARRSRSSTRASTTTTRTAASSRSRAASPAPTASCTPASVRSTSTAAR